MRPTDSLAPFHAAHARELAGWAATAEEARRWGGQDVVWPMAASVFSAWHADPGVRPFVLARGGVLLGYGEVWIDADEREVELARVIVRPERRGQGLGRLLVRLLLEQAAETGYQAAFVRVVPDNAACTRLLPPRRFRPGGRAGAAGLQRGAAARLRLAAP